MRVIYAKNVNDAFYTGINMLKRHGVKQNSRAGYVLVMPTPVMTAYEKPQQRVLFHSKRDANPFFHLFEALWMLAGRNDGTWLDQFVHDFSSRFAEEDGHVHGAYGFRWRKHFDMEGGGDSRLPDQLETIVRLLKANPDDRRVVLQMWDPVADLGVDAKDICCNTQAYFRIRSTQDNGVSRHPMLLDMTVCCRSNDAVWGAYGANAVHFSILQEYLAARIGVGIGTYYQMSNNFHIYSDMVEKLGELESEGDYYHNQQVLPTPIVTAPDDFDAELQLFMGNHPIREKYDYKNKFFPEVAMPLLKANTLWKAKERDEALWNIQALPASSDWKMVVGQWTGRRMYKKTVGEVR